MKWPLFENKIKDELSGHRSEVDIDALWGAIEPEVDAINKYKRKRRYGIIWFLFAGVLLLGNGLGFYFLNNSGTSVNESVSGENLNEIIREKKDDDLIGNTNTNSNSNSNTTIDHSEDSVKKTDTVFENKKQIENSNKGLNKKSIAPNGLKNNKNQININAPTADKSKLKNIKTGGSFFEDKNKNGISAKNINSEKTIDLSVSNNVVNDLTNDFLENQPKIETRTSNQINDIRTLSIPLFRTTSNVPKIRIPSLKAVLAENTTPPGQPEKYGHPMAKKYFHFSIAANGGFSYANRKLGIGNDTTGTANDLIKLRKRTEKQLETSHLGLQLNMLHESGFDITTGLQYTRMVERFDYNENITTTDSILGIAYYAVNPNNDTIGIMGTIPHTTHIDILKKYYNRYTMFDIPVLIGYFKENDGWVYGAQAGVFANISLKTEGRFLKSEKEDEDIKDLFKSSVGLSYYLGISGGYQINDHIEIGVSPYFRYFPKNFAIADYPISQKYMLIGVDARVRYWF